MARQLKVKRKKKTKIKRHRVKARKSQIATLPIKNQSEFAFENVKPTSKVSARLFNFAAGTKFDPNTYEVDDSFIEQKSPKFDTARTVPEMINVLRNNKNVEISGSVLGLRKTHRGQIVLESKSFTNKKQFNEMLKTSETSFKESGDAFGFNGAGGGDLVGENDFVSLLGGPFNKQLYPRDYLKAHAACFYAYHHDPFAKAAVHIIKDMVLGRGFDVNSIGEDEKARDIAQAKWDAFAVANKFDSFIENWLLELEIYGEQMTWLLPNMQKFMYVSSPGETNPKGSIQRITPIDPSGCWDICTAPEDINRVMFYQLVYPTQWQSYTSPDMPTSKFVFQQVPADQVIHTKINSVSNEKRGRSDLFAVLGYLKRLRDSVNYSIIGMQKAAAWSIDTEIDGNSEDLLAYENSQKSMGTIPTAASEFIHTKKVKRTYLGNQAAGRGGNSNAFEWALSMVCVGIRIPLSWFGTHIGNATNRASAIVSTEPVAKMIESRQILVERFVKQLFKIITDSECEVTFPQIISQDSSQQIKNIITAETQGYIKKARAAEMVAKELNITDFDYDKEKAEVEAAMTMPQQNQNPLSAPAKVDVKKPSALPSDERKKIKDAR